MGPLLRGYRWLKKSYGLTAFKFITRAEAAFVNMPHRYHTSPSGRLPSCVPGHEVCILSKNFGAFVCITDDAYRESFQRLP